MPKSKLIRITTVPLSLEKLLEDQLQFMSQYYDVTAVSSDKERLERYGKAEGVAVSHLELTRKITPLKDISAVYKLYKFLRNEKPLIVHTHTPKAGIVGMMASYFAKVPLRMHTVAGLPLMEATGVKRSILNMVEKLTYKLATHVYPNSKGLYDFIVAKRFTLPTKLKIIGNGSSNGIDTTYFDPNLYTKENRVKTREELKIPQGDFVFTFVGRMVKDKGINELIAAFLKLNNLKKNCSLLLVGPLEEDLDPLNPETLEQINTHKKIIAIGYQKDVRPFFACSDALVFPSYREGFPNVVMQAGAMNLPVIATNINGCNEIITDYKNGLLIPTKNTAAVNEAMAKLLNDEDLNRKLTGNAREEIVSKYERKEICEALLTEYREQEAKL